MIRHAKQNAKLYEEMVALGFSDESFPVWWYSARALHIKSNLSGARINICIGLRAWVPMVNTLFWVPQT